jgi:hypothetical protein
MACKDIVPFTIWDIAAGLDRCNQGRGGVVKDSDGGLWTPTDKTPIEAAMCGIALKWLRGDKICDR